MRQQGIHIQGFGVTGAGANIYSYLVAPGTLVDVLNPVIVSFAASDYLLDNLGGISMKVTPVPEPATDWPWLAGLGGLLARRPLSAP